MSNRTLAKVSCDSLLAGLLDTLLLLTLFSTQADAEALQKAFLRPSPRMSQIAIEPCILVVVLVSKILYAIVLKPQRPCSLQTPYHGGTRDCCLFTRLL